MPRPSVNRLYLALWFPWLSAERLLRTTPNAACGAPLAFLEKTGGALRLAAVDRQARRLGLEPGMAMADARACVPDLRLFDHDPRADRLWLERLADGCLRYTPTVAFDMEDGLTLEIAGSAHLFGGADDLVADIETRLSRLDMTVRHALAGTAEAAQALARHAAAAASIGEDQATDWRKAIRALPVAALRLGEERQTALRRAGLNRVGDLLDRPLATIAARFGADAVAAIRAIGGEIEPPIVPRRVVPMITAERRFAEPLGTSDQALAVLRLLADETAQALEQRKRGGRVFIARFFRCDGLCRALTVASGRPTRDPDAIMRLFGERLDTLSDPLDPGFGFDLIRLDIPVADPLAAHQIGLDREAPAADAVDALVDRLSIRLGRDRVRRLVPVDTHIPERAQRALPASNPRMPDMPWPSPPDVDGDGTGEDALPRPVRLFDPPQRIEVVAAVPDGPPLRFRWRRALHKVRRVEGPERIASEWWRRKDGHQPGAGGLTRDYYRVEDASGRRFWLFRHGLYGTEVGHPDWYVHGLFP